MQRTARPADYRLATPDAARRAAAAAAGLLRGEPNPGCDLVVLAGVPGAGKSTVMRAVAATDPRVRVVDPEQVARRIAPVIDRLWPDARIPYRRYRPLVHLIHVLRLLAWVTRGPRPGEILLLHAALTHQPRRRVLGRWATARGWRTGLVAVDVTRDEATSGQRARGRVVDAGSFDRHWRRWLRLRPRLAQLSRHGSGRLADEPGWQRMVLAPRHDAAETVVAMAQSLGHFVSGSDAS